MTGDVDRPPPGRSNGYGWALGLFFLALVVAVTLRSCGAFR